MKKIMTSMLLFFPLLVGGVSAEQYKVGSKVKPFAANDQHGRVYQFNSKTRFLLLSMDMATGKKANKVLDAKGAAYFPQKKAAYLANIHGMPGIGRYFAFKKMKKYSHRIIYGDDKDLMTPFPTQKDKVTVLKLNSKESILKVSYWDPAKEDVEMHLK